MGALLASLAWAGQHYAHGVLGPDADFVCPGLATDATGRLEFSGTWPPGLEPGQQVILQFWLHDHAAPAGLSATNNLIVTAPAD